MIRVVLFLIFVALLAAGAAWLADRPGEITILWLNRRIETSVMVGAAAIALLAVLAIFAWSLLRLALRSPHLAARALRERRRGRASRAISRGLIAIGAGDTRAARRFAAEADRLAAHEPLALLLSAQTAQLAGDRAGAERAFRAMAARPDTKLLGLRGLFVEAQRRNDPAAARQYAEQAAHEAPAVPWAGQAVLQHRCSTADWAGALAALDRMRQGGQVDKQSYRRQRAVLVTARALAEPDPQTAKALALEAAKLAPDLVPASALAARLLAEGGDPRKAMKVLEAGWRAQPHPDLAEVCAHLRPGDAARERLARVETLTRQRPHHVESAFAVARAALDAQEFSTARAALGPLAAAPTQRAAMLMAELEEMQAGDVGRAREWMARALRAPRDGAWIGDGYVSDQWLPVSPVSGRLDAFEWGVPGADLGGRGALIEAPRAAPPDLPAVPASAPSLPAVARDDSADTPPRLGRNGPESVAEAEAQPDTAIEPDQAPLAPERRPPGARPIIPLVHAPDDPGPPEAAPSPGNGRRKLSFW